MCLCCGHVLKCSLSQDSVKVRYQNRKQNYRKDTKRVLNSPGRIKKELTTEETQRLKTKERIKKNTPLRKETQWVKDVWRKTVT